MIFTGFSENSIDSKNRVAIPAKFRNRLGRQRDGKAWMVVPGKPPDRLWLYSHRRFEELAAKATSALIPNEDLLRFDQAFFPGAEYQELDSQGRILIPERMLRKAGLGREVVICGVRDHLEIRRREGFEQELDQDWARVQEYQLKAQEAYQRVGRQPGPAEE